jgi:hypothetical protein
MTFGVLGLILTAVVAPVPSLIMGLAFIKRTYGLTVDLASSARILLASAVAGTVTYFVVSELVFASWIRLLLGVVVFVVVLVPALLLTRSITKADVGNLRGMVDGLGALGGLIIKVLSLIERIMIYLKI